MNDYVLIDQPETLQRFTLDPSDCSCFIFFLKQRWARGHLAYQCSMDEKSSQWSCRVLYEPVVYGGCFSTTSKRVQRPDSIDAIWLRCWYTPEHPLLCLKRDTLRAGCGPLAKRDARRQWLKLVNTGLSRPKHIIHKKRTHKGWLSVWTGTTRPRNYIEERADRNNSTAITGISLWSADRNLFLTAIPDSLRLTSQTWNLAVKPSGIKT
jgi:hypothetical protein